MSLADLTRRVEAACRHAGVEILEVEGLGAPCAETVENGRYRILLDAAVAADRELRGAALLHGLAHVMRGDLLVQGVDRETWHVAADCLVNRSLDPVHLEQLGGFRYEDIAEAIGLPSWYVPSARTIYEALEPLVAPPPAGGGAGGDADGGDDDPGDAGGGEGGADGREGGGQQPPSPMDRWESDGSMDLVDHAQVLIRLREAEPQLATALGMRPLVQDTEGGVGSWGDIRPVPVTALAQLLRHLEAAVGRRRVRSRSWRRPGRVEMLRGSYRDPVPSIAMAVDVSGSTAHLRTVLAGVARWAERRPDVEVRWAVWASRAAWTKGPGHEPDVGYGTVAQQLWRLSGLASHDLVVVLTDGEVDDWVPCPIGDKLVVVSPLRAPVGRWIKLEERR